MPSVTKTLGPLHLEDLEPHRFEDLIRQLLYDFRRWRDLEATGRTGSDEGFDARAWEIVGASEAVSAELEEGEEAEVEEPHVRQWLIQCKREKAIGPKKIEGYLDGLPKADEAGLHGLIFAAASDFSIETRDRFYQRARELGFEEMRLWGKAEIEDQLYQPKNDHLLFAYFGVSLQIRRRSLKTEVRSRLATKRKATRILKDHQSVLVRDSTDDRYPHLDPNESLSRKARGRWKVYEFEGCGPYGIELRYRRHLAMIEEDGESWDFAERMNDASPHHDPWPDPSIDKERVRKHRWEDFQQWDALPQEKKAWFELNLVLPYENVIDIDADGDYFFEGPHIYVGEFVAAENGPFADFHTISLRTIGYSRRSCAADEDKRLHVFPRRGDESTFVPEPAPDEIPSQ